MKCNSLLFDTLQSTLGDCVPVGGIVLALLEEVDEELSSLVALVGIDVEARNPVDYDLRRPSVGGCKCRQAAGHGFDYCQPKCFVEGGLRKAEAGIRESIKDARFNIFLLPTQVFVNIIIFNSNY